MLLNISTQNAPVYREAKKSEHGIKGGVMRAAVMAALHFDFNPALEQGGIAETRAPYNEDLTIMQNFVNLLA